jgi:hypothetical protein
MIQTESRSMLVLISGGVDCVRRFGTVYGAVELAMVCDKCLFMVALTLTDCVGCLFRGAFLGPKLAYC